MRFLHNFWYPNQFFKLHNLVHGVLYVVSWWFPYFFGLSEKQQREYEWRFAGTVTLLPRIGKHPVPNVERMIAGELIVLMVVSAMQ